MDNFFFFFIRSPSFLRLLLLLVFPFYILNETLSPWSLSRGLLKFSCPKLLIISPSFQSIFLFGLFFLLFSTMFLHFNKELKAPKETARHSLNFLLLQPCYFTFSNNLSKLSTRSPSSRKTSSYFYWGLTLNFKPFY